MLCFVLSQRRECRVPGARQAQGLFHVRPQGLPGRSVWTVSMAVTRASLCPAPESLGASPCDHRDAADLDGFLPLLSIRSGVTRSLCRETRRREGLVIPSLKGD